MWYDEVMKRHSPERARKRVRQLKAEGREVRWAYDWRFGSGTLHEMPIEIPTFELLEDAERAIKRAKAVRKAHARKTKRDAPQRKTDIEVAQQEIADAMKPLRRLVTQITYKDVETEEDTEVRQASLDLQKERRKLWKMAHPRKRKD